VTAIAHRPVLALALITVALAACARNGAPPPAPMGLDGQRIMLMPVRAGDPVALNDELLFWLADRAPTTEWIAPDVLQLAVDRAGGSRVRLSALPRHISDPGRSPYLADPTYGELRRLGAIVDAMLVLMPVAVRVVPDGAGQFLELTAALVDIRGGQVLWVATVQGEPGDGSARAAEAAGAEALARALFPS
jgi:hypothetical protein